GRFGGYFTYANLHRYCSQAVIDELQIQLTRRQSIVPMTRDYIAREERCLRVAEATQRPQQRMVGE
ncbi:MAG: SAM-dependent methyltransferase, partial [Pseudolabrys sp.]